MHFGCWNSSAAIVNYMATKGWQPTKEGNQNNFEYRAQVRSYMLRAHAVFEMCFWLLSGFIQLWKEFQERSSARLRLASTPEVKLIVWTSDLTKREHLDNLSPQEYIVHIWTNGSVRRIDGYRTARTVRHSYLTTRTPVRRRFLPWPKEDTR